MNHPSDDELVDYAAHPERTGTIAAHVAECETCRSAVTDYQAVDRALRSRDIWSASVQRRATYQRRNAAFAEAARLDAERTAAEAALQPLLASIVRFTNARVVEQAVFQTIGGISVLTQAARAARDHQPQFAVRISEAAVTLARRLTRVKTPEVGGALGAHAHALLEHGIALFLTGSYRDAEKALKAAGEVFEEDRRSTSWEVACVWLALANVCVETERPAEAELLADGAARQFAGFGDTLREVLARLIGVQVKYGRQQYEQAAALAEEIISVAREEDRRSLLGTALVSAGLCYVELSQYERAAECYGEALPIWDEIGADLPRSHAEWAFAHLSLRSGNAAAAVPQLQSLLPTFELLGAKNDAALIRLDLAESFLLLNQAVRVPDLLRDVVVTFSSEGCNRLARMALAYIAEAAAMGRLRPDDIRHVRSYLRALPFRPEVAFTPLQ